MGSTPAGLLQNSEHTSVSQVQEGTSVAFGTSSMPLLVA